MSEKNSKTIELHFPVQGKLLPSDHGYPLFSAICEIVPNAHEAEWLGIHTIKGRKDDRGSIRISRHSKLRLRMPIDKVAELYSLAGSNLEIGGYQIKLGVPEIHLLRPSSSLRARFVTIKLKGSEGRFAEAESFLEGVRKQVSDLGVRAEIELERNLLQSGQDEGLARRALRVKDVTITGYGLILRGLSDVDSLLIQERGLGGRRRMGCGLFDPIKVDSEG
ncbi:MAG: type I-MYXAN CRISPR-associated protein Cas6/Cmx6 [Candidatus Obscuribacterales bacterium]|nr:type I-MYXAN CRISPR-associated protein Cas6/Cmx6 [Candidatus Obscuribacterales bacterium]